MIYYTFESTAFVLISCSVFELYIVSEARIQSIQIQIANIFENWVLFFHICYKTKILLISQTHQFWFYHSEWNLIRLKVPDGDIFSDHFHFLSVFFRFFCQNRVWFCLEVWKLAVIKQNIKDSLNTLFLFWRKPFSPTPIPAQ